MIDRDKSQLKRMRVEVEFIIDVTTDASKEKFLNDDLLQHGVCMSLLTIGECANHLSAEFTEKHPEIPWIQVIAVRNIAAHGYWQLNMEQIWEAIASDIPELYEFLQNV
ncbi:MAG: DUF86 domain-containing protein [Acidobacteriota bacterium]|jgi:uncharacterized protein with HEPN domain|nr:DUF86 domain-containing protein [Acidobacteriota bacterium]